MERKAKMEDNTENQLHALMNKAVSKKSSMPVLGGHMAVTGGLLGQGQKEEAYDIPATSVRRPVFARTITTEPEEKVSTRPVTSTHTCPHIRYKTEHSAGRCSNHQRFLPAENHRAEAAEAAATARHKRQHHTEARGEEGASQ